MARPRKIPEGSDEIRFFSEIDMNTKNPGTIGSSYPSWYLKPQLRFLNESIEQEERELESDTSGSEYSPLSGRR